jgi:hypothetical protein
MKIVNRKTFLAMPPKIVFMKYEPEVFEGLAIKEETIKDCNDFFFSNLHDSIDAQNNAECTKFLTLAEEAGESVPLDFEILQRDGCFNDEQLFAVLEKWDVRNLIEVLKKAL